MEASLEWIKDMNFKAKNRDLTIEMDATFEHGGHNSGPSPKELVLDAMMGCTAMDVISMLTKMRSPVEKFSMKIVAEKSQDYPVHFKTAVLIYNFQGSLEESKVIKAVNASLTKYCGVNYMISKTCLISFKVYLNEKLIHSGDVRFQEPSA